VAQIDLVNITKQYDDGHEAVRDISIRIDDGEFVILVGPSGCGKSTALRMIAGLEEITDGELRVGGEVVNHVAAKDRDVAMVFQNYALYPHMSVRGNMGFALRLARVDRDERERRVTEAARLLDLVDHLDRRPAQLSGGQRQRVAMGRAMVRDPKAFLLDEPLSNLDAKLRVQMRTEIARLQQQLGTTTVYVTHDQTEAMTLGDRVAVLRDGTLQQVGAPMELYAEPSNLFVASFIGSPAMNLMPAVLEADALRIPLADIELSPGLGARVSGFGGRGRVVAGIRPDAFQDAALVPDAPARGVVFEAPVEVLEELGSELYAHLAIPRRDHGLNGGGETIGRAGADVLNGSGAEDLVARLDPASTVREREVATVWLDPDKIHLFDPHTGERLQAW
jgi:multiple sugar transport system ATP-binding protein